MVHNYIILQVWEKLIVIDKRKGLVCFSSPGVGSWKLKVSLPWHLVGSVPITNYSTTPGWWIPLIPPRRRTRMIWVHSFYSEIDK